MDCDKIHIAEKVTLRGVYLGRRQIDEETDQDKTGQYLAGTMVSNFKKSHREAKNKWADEEHKLDAAREQRGTPSPLPRPHFYAE